MAERQVEKQEPEELNQLENQVKDIQGELERILMAPRSEKEVKRVATANDNDFAEDELEGDEAKWSTPRDTVLGSQWCLIECAHATLRYPINCFSHFSHFRNCQCRR